MDRSNRKLKIAKIFLQPCILAQMLCIERKRLIKGQAFNVIGLRYLTCYNYHVTVYRGI